MEKIVLWKDRANGTIDPTLFSTKAENFAQQIAQDNQNARSLNKRTQLRKFFDEIVSLNMEAKTNPNGWSSIFPLVHMVTAKAAYAKGRNLISDNFLQFIRESVEQVEKPEDLDVFASFFESFIGFYRFHGPTN
ncbi:MAG: type III-A CRISPR-associated protein Csm2 [Thermodesulfobacteriota bacterium]|nr:type III-A CRISPR-associated protein Csm2 [Thermodesulfobacteriota bacterium]